jgi:hypothetical protein
VKDPWLGWLGAAALVSLVVAALLFGVFRSSLGARARVVQETSLPIAR